MSITQGRMSIVQARDKARQILLLMHSDHVSTPILLGMLNGDTNDKRLIEFLKPVKELVDEVYLVLNEEGNEL